jgi:glutamate dehydrogenase
LSAFPPTPQSTLLDDILAHAPALSSPRESQKQRAELAMFFATVPADDLAALPPAESCALAVHALAFARTYTRGEPKIRVEEDTANASVRIFALNEDRPFLVDSLSLLLQRLGIAISALLHPILTPERNAEGEWQSLNPRTNDAKHPAESLIVVAAGALPAGLSAEQLEEAMQRVFRQGRAVTEDWKKMAQRVQTEAKAVHVPAGKFPEVQTEIAHFLHWLAARHFVFLGIADFTATARRDALTFEVSSALGLYRLYSTTIAQGEWEALEFTLTPAANDHITVTKSTQNSEVHRAVPMDLIILARYDEAGKRIGETRILGLFTSNVYYQPTDTIPLLRGKTGQVLKRSGFEPTSHNGKALRAVLEFLPRDELLQLSEDALYELSLGVLSLEAHPKVRVFARSEPFGRFVSCLAYVPRERYSTRLREQISALLSRAYGAQLVTFYTTISDSTLARVHLILALGAKPKKAPDLAAIEEEITLLTREWRDELRTAFADALGVAKGEASYLRYRDAFPAVYVDDHAPAQAVFDTRRIEDALRGDGLALELYRRPEQAQHVDDLHLKCYSTAIDSTLSDIVPVFEHLGAKLVEVHPYIVTPSDGKALILRDFILRVPNGEALDLATHKARLEAGIGAIWRGEVASDMLNALLFTTGLNHREIDVLRAFGRYLRQIGFPYGFAFITRALTSHPQLATLLAEYFDLKFNPIHKEREARLTTARENLLSDLEAVSNLAEDRVIRRMLELMDASLRTNVYQRDAEGNAKPYLSIKFNSALIPELPLPKPYAEIFVYSMTTEGIHLRGAKVARGGLRWSDRAEDFRTEVLGLMKAQMVKNVVIVPQGSKGGFIVKRSFDDRAALQKEAIKCYQQFLRGLLDLTDNITAEGVIPPARTVRHDGDDPYLVVAADKGTASFSDIANGISAEYGFWLGDAFASGGSVGYDHKEMGITARGAWVSVERHFRELARDIANEPFTVCGVGDMSGDVFGNGMLLSKNIQLIAAFNHRHIFLDPTPDAATSFAERERLFHLSGSAWSDYNAELISKGGGVFERSAKKITLSKEIQAALGTAQKSASPDELIQIILTAPVDLLWNGGIGTYVKAASETHDDVGDRANNAVRVDGAQLRCKIVGEGGNLGFTQKGRIEYARNPNIPGGGKINTDAIDNSAGVDCSDHEVNIKIALGHAMQRGALTLNARNSLLKKMTEEVAELVLEDNRLQTQAISLAEAQGTTFIDPARGFMDTLEKKGLLNRAVEFLPGDRQLAEMKAQGTGFARPELAVLLAYAKLSLSQDLTASPVLDDPFFQHHLMRYFPSAMQKNYAEDIAQHRLKREIIATLLTNNLINRLGMLSAHQIAEDCEADAGAIVASYAFVRASFGIDTLWVAVEALDGLVPANLQRTLFRALQRFVSETIRFTLDHLTRPLPIGETYERFAPPLSLLRSQWQSLAAEETVARLTAQATVWMEQGVPQALAQDIAALSGLSEALLIVAVAEQVEQPVEPVARLYFALQHLLAFDRLRERIRLMPTETEWQRQALIATLTQVAHTERQLLIALVRDYGTHAAALSEWQSAHTAAITRYQQFLVELFASDALDASMLLVALREIALLLEK